MINGRSVAIFGRTSGIRSLRVKGNQFLERLIRHSTPRKAANMVAANLDFQLGRVIPSSFPYHYVVDPVNSCNLKCPLCPTGSGLLKRKRGRMSLDTFANIIDQIREHAYFLDLYNWGESLLHKEIGQFIRYAARQNISVKISSNLNVLSEGQAIDLVQSGLDELVVSIDGASQATYGAYRRGGNLSTVMRNLREILQVRREIGSRLPFINVRVLLNRHNESEIVDIKRTSLLLGADNVVVAPILIDPRKETDLQEWAPSDQRRSYFDYESRLDRTVHQGSRCPYLWRSMVMSWEGGVSPCCWLHDPDSDFGDLANSSIEDVWRGQRYLNARRVFSSQRPELDTVCLACRGMPVHPY